MWIPTRIYSQCNHIFHLHHTQSKQTEKFLRICWQFFSSSSLFPDCEVDSIRKLENTTKQKHHVWLTARIEMKSGLNVWVNCYIKNFVHQKIQFTSNGKLTIKFSTLHCCLLRCNNEKKLSTEISATERRMRNKNFAINSELREPLHVMPLIIRRHSSNASE